MMDDLSWPTLKERRTKTRLINFYKISNNKMEIPYTDILIPNQSKTRTYTQKHLDNFLAKKTALNILSFVIQYRIGINSMKP
jgi:hypothetical protein